MKRIYTLVLATLMVLPAIAQDNQAERNQTYRIVLSNVQYAHHDEKLSAGDAVGKVLTGVLTGQTSVEASKYEEDVKNGIIKGLSGAYRFRYDDSLTPLQKTNADNDITVDAKIMNIQAKSSSRTWKDKDNKTQVTTTYTGENPSIIAVEDRTIDLATKTLKVSCAPAGGFAAIVKPQSVVGNPAAHP